MYNDTKTLSQTQPEEAKVTVIVEKSASIHIFVTHTHHCPE